MSSLPELETKFDQTLEQLFLLIRDVELHKWDAGVTVMVNNGQIDVRGLATIDTPAAAFALLFMALRTLPPISQQEVMAELKRIMERSERIEKEAEYWRDVVSRENGGGSERHNKYRESVRAGAVSPSWQESSADTRQPPEATQAG